MLGEGTLITPSTEVRTTGREKFCKLLVLCDGVGPPAVDGRVTGAATAGRCWGRNLIEDAESCGPESVDTRESEESLRCELVDLEPPVGERGPGGGRKGGNRSLMIAACFQWSLNGVALACRACDSRCRTLQGSMLASVSNISVINVGRRMNGKTCARKDMYVG